MKILKNNSNKTSDEIALILYNEYFKTNGSQYQWKSKCKDGITIGTFTFSKYNDESPSEKRYRTLLENNIVDEQLESEVLESFNELLVNSIEYVDDDDYTQRLDDLYEGAFPAAYLKDWLLAQNNC